MLTAFELAMLVADMREAQKLFVRTSSKTALDRAKALERRVDSAVRARLAGPDLFPESGLFYEESPSAGQEETP